MQADIFLLPPITKAQFQKFAIWFFFQKNEFDFVSRTPNLVSSGLPEVVVLEDSDPVGLIAANQTGELMLDWIWNPPVVFLPVLQLQ